MLWHWTVLGDAPPEEATPDKDYPLEELLDDDEIIQVCKVFNVPLVNYLRKKSTVKQLISYIVEEPREDADEKRRFKFPFVACEILTCEVDAILSALVEDVEMMDMLFSFLDRGRVHSNILPVYFNKVVVRLLLQETSVVMNYIRDHQDIIERLVDLIEIPAMMEILIRVICVHENIFSKYTDSMLWLNAVDVPERLVNKFSSSDCSKVHANAAEALSAIVRFAPQGLRFKIYSPSFIKLLFHHALGDSRPKSVLVNLLSVCISLLDPESLPSATYDMFAQEPILFSGSSTKADIIQAMLENLGGLLKHLGISSDGHSLPTTYGTLQPPLGRHRLKIVEFLSLLLAVGEGAVEKEFKLLGVVQRLLDLFFEYPFNNFLHHHVECIVQCCLESTNAEFVEYLFHHCNLVGRIIEADKNHSLSSNADQPTVHTDGRKPPRLGNIGHLTRIANKLILIANSNSEILKFLQGNSDWVDWYRDVLVKRNAVEDVHQWESGRPVTVQERIRYSDSDDDSEDDSDDDDDDFQDCTYEDSPANNLIQAFRPAIYSNEAPEKEEYHESDHEEILEVYEDAHTAATSRLPEPKPDDKENCERPDSTKTETICSGSPPELVERRASSSVTEVLPSSGGDKTSAGGASGTVSSPPPATESAGASPGSKD